MGGAAPRADGVGPARVPLAVVLALSAGVFGRAHPFWGCALFASAYALLWPAWQSGAGRALALGLLGSLSASAWTGSLNPTKPLPLNEEHRFRGAVVDDPARVAGGTRLLVDVSDAAAAEPGPWSPQNGRVALQVEGSPDPRPGRGDVVLFRASLRPPWGLRNPGAGGFSDYLSRRGVGARATARWPQEVAFAAPGPGAPRWLRWRRATARAMEAAVPGQAGPVLAALTVGDWSGVLPETSASFRRAGTTHLLAISGLHLGILAMMVLPAIRGVLLRMPSLSLARPVDPLARVLVLPLLACYAGLAGFQSSTLRSLVMTSLLVAGSALSRPVSALGCLASAVAVLGVFSPSALSDPGLQLSAAALVGLFWLAPRMEARWFLASEPVDLLAPPPGRGRRFFATFGIHARRLAVAGVAASLATTPVSAFHFGSSSLLGMVLNPMAVPWVEFLCLPVALAGTALGQVWAGGGELLWRISGWGLATLMQIQRALVPVSPMLKTSALATPAGCLGAFALLTGFGLALENPVRRRPVLLLLLAGSTALAGPSAASWVAERASTDVHLWALDVGQGQALAVKFPPDRWVLVDAGGFPGSGLDAGEKVVVPALEALGATRLWLAVSTHPHPDHLLGFASAVRLGRPGRIWLPGAFSGDERYRATLDAAAAVGATVEWIGPALQRRSERLGAAGLEAVWADGVTENDRSLVLRVTNGSTTAVLPADAEASAQSALLSSGFDPRCDLLLAPHHGSANAVHEPFLRAARPSTIFVSAGNRSSLPSVPFLSAAERLGCAVLGTHQSGALHAILGRHGLSVTRPKGEVAVNPRSLFASGAPLTASQPVDRGLAPR